MKNKALIVLLLLASLKLGFYLRSIGYSVIPDPFIILDEHTNVWHGLSIRSSGVPAAWSILPFYAREAKSIGAGGNIDGFNLSVDGKKPRLSDYSSFPKPVVGVSELNYGRGLSHTQFVQPYIDHPPFGALILSLFVSKEAKTFKDVSDYDLRRASLYLGTITQFLIFVLATLLTEKWVVGIIASFIYATVPSYVLMSRYALLENVMSPLFLLSIILLLLAKGRLKRKDSDRLTFLLILIAGIAGGLVALTKIAGWFLILADIILMLVWKFGFRRISVYVVPAFLIGSLYFIWGFYLSPKLFLDLFLTQASRDFIGSINFLVTSWKVSIFNFPVDGWWTGGFLSLFMIPREKRYLPIFVSVLMVLMSALFLVGSNYPWYFIPLIPFMAISVAIFFYNISLKPDPLHILFAFFFFVSSSFYWGYGVFQKLQPFLLYRLLFLMFVVLGVFGPFIYNRSGILRKVWSFGIFFLLLILLILNRRSIFFILEHWGKYPLIYTPGTF